MWVRAVSADAEQHGADRRAHDRSCRAPDESCGVRLGTFEPPFCGCLSPGGRFETGSPACSAISAMHFCTLLLDANPTVAFLLREDGNGLMSGGRGGKGVVLAPARLP